MLPDVRPFLKWAGGKTEIRARILDVLPRGKRLIEPFVGSGAVFLGASFERFLLCDSNPDLINCYAQLKAHGAKFIVDLRALFTPQTNTPERYYECRDQFNLTDEAYEKALLFVYLNRHSYNGLCRYNKSGKFNVPFGRYKSPYFPELELHAFYVKASLAEIKCQTFESTFRAARHGDVIYCDPPYVPISATANFTDFTAQGFNEGAQRALAVEALRASEKGIPVVISNHATALSRELYRGAEIIEFSARRRISRNVDNRAEAAELLALYRCNSPAERTGA